MENKVMAYVHSLKQEGDPENGDFGHQQAEVTIIRHNDNNNVVAEYNGVRCKAVFNPFAGSYFVDDVYGKITE
ncbi:MAG: hypothetical protein LBI03_05935 [Clostridiales bacterium]|jgi:hypothetical protein|nr:hypothetical protein [Clostridiales bacterium]